MICSECRDTKKVPTHTTDLTIGTVSETDATVYVFVKNLSTGYTHRETVVSDPSGTVILDMTLPHYSFYNENSTYHLWITDENNELLEITIGNEINECLTLSFKDLYEVSGGNNEHVEYSEYELVLKE